MKTAVFTCFTGALCMGLVGTGLAQTTSKNVDQAYPSKPIRFVVGFGMDAYGYWRNLPGLWAIQTES